MDKGKSPISKNSIKMYNKDKNFYEPCVALALEPSKYDLYSSQGELSHHYSPSHS